MSDNVGTVAAIYEAFGRGDIPWIIDQMDEQVEWEHGIRSTAVPYLQSGTGKQHVARFFEHLGQTAEITHFEVVAICDGGAIVSAPLRVGGRIIDGGEIPVTDEVHVWRFRDGKVVAFNHVFDVAVHEAALALRPVS